MKAAIGAVLSHVRAGGCTNLSGGSFKGVEHVNANKASERIKRVPLLTDGQDAGAVGRRHLTPVPAG